MNRATGKNIIKSIRDIKGTAMKTLRRASLTENGEGGDISSISSSSVEASAARLSDLGTPGRRVRPVGSLGLPVDVAVEGTGP